MQTMMYRLYLKIPGPEDKVQVMSYRQAHYDSGETVINGCGGLDKVDAYEAWLARLQCNSCDETVLPGLVPASTFLAVLAEDGRVVGMIDIRHRLNEYLRKLGGHVGYGLHPDERGKGYGTEMLALGLEECRKLGLEKVLLTCNKDNIASASVMLKNGAVLENEVPDGEKTIQRYWIAL